MSSKKILLIFLASLPISMIAKAQGPEEPEIAPYERLFQCTGIANARASIFSVGISTGELFVPRREIDRNNALLHSLTAASGNLISHIKTETGEDLTAEFKNTLSSEVSVWKMRIILVGMKQVAADIASEIYNCRKDLVSTSK